MKILVTSEDHPEGEVRRLVMWAAEMLEVAGYVEDVKVTSAKWSHSGRCYEPGKRVLLRVGAPDLGLFPSKGRSYPGLVTAPKYDLHSWQEALVKVAAHEFQHTRQFMARAKVRWANKAAQAAAIAARGHSRDVVLQKLPRLSEIEADRAALWVLSRFRDPAVRETLDQAITRMEEKVQARSAALRNTALKKKAEAKDPARLAVALQAKIARWETKRKTAETYLKKYQRRLRRLEQAIAKSKVGEESIGTRGGQPR